MFIKYQTSRNYGKFLTLKCRPNARVIFVSKQALELLKFPEHVSVLYDEELKAIKLQPVDKDGHKVNIVTHCFSVGRLPMSMPDGRYEMQDDDVFVLNSNTNTVAKLGGGDK